ncbi:MAG: Nif3-like dinuclear metal center hexameric protein [Bacteroidetes bacterium]|nr:Nif3-like dinuclear metal center hexameric protein [Bacteroidota bacterium]
MKIKTITQCLESIAPLSLQEEYDNSGLLIGNEENEISGVLIALDCTEEVLDEAVKKNCNLIIAHHPIIFKGLKKITGRNYVERVVEKAIKNNISIYAIHTNLDNVSVGVNKKICDKLGLTNCKILLPTFPLNKGGALRIAEAGDVGSGMIGTLKNPSTEISFLNKIKRVMKAKSLRHTSLPGKKVSKVAVCGGSGSFLLDEAIKQKVDVFVTADFKYHQFFDAENKIVIADIGHYESEQFTKELLRDMLIEKFSIFATRFKKGEKKISLFISAINTNPINYL